MTWEGRRLISTTKNGASIQYSYDDSGLRLSKQDSSGITRYTYDNGKIVHQYTENNGVISNELFFRYDENGAPLSVNYNGTEYFYVLNLQGDIIGLIDNTGAVVVQYTYDSWGKHSLDNISGSMASTLGVINPLRYRGYYYDTDTGFYYCISRYYDPEIGRWISPEPNVYNDAFDIDAGLIGYNIFAYCANNPVIFKDDTGESIILACVIGAVIGGVVSFASSVITDALFCGIDNIDWGAAAISAGMGVIEGALTVALPGLSVAISALSSAVESVVIDIYDEEEEDFQEIFINATVSAGFGAITGSWDNGVVNDKNLCDDAYKAFKNIGKGNHPVVKTTAKKTIRKAGKSFLRNFGSSAAENIILSPMEKGTGLLLDAAIRTNWRSL